MLHEAIQYSFYKDRIDPEKFNWLVSIDPTKTKKYARWIVETYLKSLNGERLTLERHYNTIAAYLQNYDTYKNKNVIPQQYTNIFSFKSFDRFMEFMNEHIEEFSDAVEAKNPDRDVEVLYRDKSTILVIPKSHEASRKWGGYSDWCTATSNCKFYDQYTGDGTLYIRRFFDETGKMIEDEGYQLYIPKSMDVELNRVECRDIYDETITDMHLFYDGLPKEIVRSLENQVNEFGGLNTFDEVTGSIYGDVEEDHARIVASYELTRYSDYDADVADQGDDTTWASANVFAVGQGIEPTETTNPLQTLVEFDINKGRGIYVLYTSKVTLADAYENATNLWHQAERQDQIETYDAERAIRTILGKDEKYSYVIVHGEVEDMDLDDDMQSLLNENFDFYSEWDSEQNRRHKMHEVLNDEDNEGNQYTIYFQIGFEYERKIDDPNARTSTELQRKFDNQLDLPLEEEEEYERNKIFYL